MTLETRKCRLIKLIRGLDNEVLISKLEHLFKEFDGENKALSNLSQPMRAKLDIEKFIKAQSYKDPSRELQDKLTEQADMEASIAGLLEI